MNRKDLGTCFVSLFLVPVAGVSMASAVERVSASSAAVSSADGSDGDCVSLPAGVSGEWWAESRTAVRQLRQPKADVALPLRPHAGWKAEGNREQAKFGTSVGTAGDVNGDGYDDVIIGAYLYDNGQSDEGRAFV